MNAGAESAEAGAFEAILAASPARWQAPLRRCLAGELPANVALMQLLAQATAAVEVESELVRVRSALAARRASADLDHAAERAGHALALCRAHPQAFATVRAVLGGLAHDASPSTPDAGIAAWAAAFDEAVRTSPEGSVALYALGSPELLQAATVELVDRWRAAGLLGADRTVLEIGCGIGRFQAALALEVGSVIGIDISGEMIAAARARCAGLANVRLERCSGRDLDGFDDSSIDLVLAVDSFPYLVQSGMSLAATHVRESARVLRPGGDLLILNFSYRGDLAADQAEVDRLAGAAGLTVRENGVHACRLWDGASFRLGKPA